MTTTKSQGAPTKRLKLNSEGNGFRLKIRWLSQSSIFMIYFTLCWNLFLAFMWFYSGAASSMIFAAFLSLFSVTGFWLMYCSLCELLNTTTVVLKNQNIVFRTWPIWFKGTQTIPFAEVANAGVIREESGRYNDRVFYYHYVNIYLKSGECLQLTRVSNLEEGYYVERLIEEHLGLQDDAKFDRIASGE